MDILIIVGSVRILNLVEIELLLNGKLSVSMKVTVLSGFLGGKDYALKRILRETTNVGQ